jgi:hypothetical protein
MPDSEWGLCKDCKWWQIDPGAAVEDLTMGLIPKSGDTKRTVR